MHGNGRKVTFEGFCENLDNGKLTHESGFRKQQEKCKAGELSNDRKNKLTAVLGSDWESDNITALRNCVRDGDIGIKQMGLTDALAELESKTDGIRY